jgi:hypothetical protein
MRWYPEFIDISRKDQLGSILRPIWIEVERLAIGKLCQLPVSVHDHQCGLVVRDPVAACVIPGEDDPVALRRPDRDRVHLPVRKSALGAGGRIDRVDSGAVTPAGEEDLVTREDRFLR